ncbi:hypothetical protein ACH518_15100 [Methylomonas sp. HW2-6]|uniref:hypothetical protein n=1 Tax=Methylomonas sp. HW2-6 TaxID=3376687 RepID=UPI004041C473
MFDVDNNQSLPSPESLLGITMPADLVSSPGGIRIKRRRQIPVDWGKILEFTDLIYKDGSYFFKRYIEKSWSYEKEVKPGEDGKIKLPNLIKDGIKKTSEKSRFSSIDSNEIKSGLIVIHKRSNREYLLINWNGIPLEESEYDKLVESQDGFINEAEYNEFWDKVDSLVLVSDSIQNLKDSLPTAEAVTSQESELLRDFDALIKLKQITDALYQKAEKSFENSSNLEEIELNSLMARWEELSLRRRHINGRLKELINRALNSGYILLLETRKVKLPDGTDKNLSPGILYRVFEKVFKWNIQEQREEWVWDGDLGKIFNKKKKRRYTVTVEKQETGTDYEEVVVDDSPWLHKVQKYIKDKKTVFLLTTTKQGLFTENGLPAEELLERCDNDDLFRKDCIIGFPISRTTVFGDLDSVGYLFIERPLPPIKPSRPPSFNLIETLSSGVKWQGIEYGRLVTSIPLAPGEERSISISLQEESQNTIAVSRALGTETLITDSQDLSQEIEKEYRKEGTSNFSASMSSGVEIPLEVVSINAENDLNYATSLTTFSREFARTTQRAARNLSRRRSEQYSVSTTSSSRLTSSSSTQIKVSNINEGRTLNLLLFQLANKFETGLFLDNLEVEVDTGMEFFPGISSYVTKRVPLDNVDRIVRVIAENKIIFPVGKELLKNFSEQFSKALIDLLNNEYGEVDDTSEFKSTTSVQMLPFFKATEELNIFDVAKQLEGWDKKLIGRVVEGSIANISIPSGAFFIDAVVGQGIATEDYSEQMRVVEIQKGHAEIEYRNAQARAERARSIGLAMGVVTNRITSFEINKKDQSYDVVIYLNQELTHGEWEVKYNGKLWFKRSIKIDEEISSFTQAWDVNLADGSKPEYFSLRKNVVIKSIDTGESIRADI